MEFLAKTGVAIENFLGIAGFDVYWYGILIATGFALAFVVCTLWAKKRGFPSDMTTDLLIIAVIGAIIGARSYYVAFEWNMYYVPNDLFATLGRIVDLRQGGLAIYGGVIGAVIGIAIYAKRKKYYLTHLIDLCAAPLALGQAIGRWGNFFNQEAHGALVTDPDWQFFPYAVYLDSPKANEPVGWYQATFFYESIWCFIIFGVLMYLLFKQKYRGQIVLWYLALYGFERGIVEWLRTDQLLIYGLPVSALLSIALCVVATALLIVYKVKDRRNQVTFELTDKSQEDKTADEDTAIKGADEDAVVQDTVEDTVAQDAAKDADVKDTIAEAAAEDAGAEETKA